MPDVREDGAAGGAGVSEVADWTAWSRNVAATRGGGLVTRAVGVLLAEAKVAALWISGSRAVSEADEHSDTDIRIHAPGWTEADFERWLNAVQPERPVRWRLSKLGPAVWNYECLFEGDVPVDLLAFGAAEGPVVSLDSVILKGGAGLRKLETLQLVKEAPIDAREVQRLVDGAAIDQQKFEKLFARGERLGAWFLLEAVRFSLLRLAYVAVRGVDCGAKPVHTLASVKRVRRTLREQGGAAAAAWLAELEAEGSLEESAARLGRLAIAVSAAVAQRFPEVRRAEAPT